MQILFPQISREFSISLPTINPLNPLGKRKGKKSKSTILLDPRTQNERRSGNRRLRDRRSREKKSGGPTSQPLLLLTPFAENNISIRRADLQQLALILPDLAKLQELTMNPSAGSSAAEKDSALQSATRKYSPPVKEEW